MTAIPKSNEWAPVVHGRTAYLDFRPALLAHPEDFGKETVRWLHSDAILGSTRFAESLREHGPRWVLAYKDGKVICGVAAMNSWFSDDLTHEIAEAGGKATPRRPLFSFVGFAKQHTPGEPLHLPPMDQALYRKIFDEQVRPRFYERRNGTKWEIATKTKPQPIENTLHIDPVKGQVNLSEAHIFPHSAEKELFAQAAQRAAAGEEIYLCTNVNHLNHAAQMTHATIHGQEQMLKTERKFDKPPTGKPTPRDMPPSLEPKPAQGRSWVSKLYSDAHGNVSLARVSGCALGVALTGYAAYEMMKVTNKERETTRN